MRALVLVLIIGFLPACGGGDKGGGDQNPPPPPADTALDWDRDNGDEEDGR